MNLVAYLTPDTHARLLRYLGGNLKPGTWLSRIVRQRLVRKDPVVIRLRGAGIAPKSRHYESRVVGFLPCGEWAELLNRHLRASRAPSASAWLSSVVEEALEAGGPLPARHNGRSGPDCLPELQGDCAGGGAEGAGMLQRAIPRARPRSPRRDRARGEGGGVMSERAAVAHTLFSDEDGKTLIMRLASRRGPRGFTADEACALLRWANGVRTEAMCLEMVLHDVVWIDWEDGEPVFTRREEGS